MWVAEPTRTAERPNQFFDVLVQAYGIDGHLLAHCLP